MFAAMSSMIVVSDVRRVWEFVHASTGLPLSTTTKALGLERDGRIVAGVLYEGWNGINAWMHVAIEPGAYLGRRYPWYVFHYPFVELGCKRLTGWVEESNLAALQFDLALGFQVEARVAGAASDGGDVLLLVMRPENCKWLKRAPSMALSRE